MLLFTAALNLSSAGAGLLEYGSEEVQSMAAKRELPPQLLINMK
jgi:hypothetical protein